MAIASIARDPLTPLGPGAAAWFIARSDLKHMLSHRETLMWVFVMPVIFFYFIGTVMAGFGGDSSDRGDPLALRGASQGGVLVDELVRRLEAQHYEVSRPATDEAFAKAALRLTIPAPVSPRTSFTDAVLAGERQVLTLEYRSDALAGSYDQVRVARAVYEVVGDLAVVRLNGDAVTPEAFAKLAAMPRALTLTVQSAGKRLDPPLGFAQAVPGTLVMFTMLVLLTSGAITLVIEREQGLLRRLASTPISRGSIVLGKWIGRMLLALVQIAFAMLIGVVLFKIDWGHTVLMVGAVMFGWAAFTASLAILLSNVTRTQAQTTGIGVFATQILAALGGCWWPIEITPSWMQKLALVLPTGWAMDALHKLVNFGDPAVSALPHVVALLTGAVVLGWIGARRFKYQ
jgi:ABC-2 type transport system permease protein